ncbi:MAG: phytanoyl-CoA dioxygenase family protein [Granulosicoccus sp.]|nr:phytanoyl-CoA dioxygenase family protein [Granulosicoccus sp.]
MVIPTHEDVRDFQDDGVVLLRGLLKDYVGTLRQGVNFNLQNPGPYAAENTSGDDSGRFFDDYCNWSRISEFETVIRESPLAEAASRLMQSDTVQLFHEHVLIKTAGTDKPTPWHQDSPYYFVQGTQTVSFWCPLDTVTSATLRCVAGSHRWERPVLPVRWLNEENFYDDQHHYQQVPDPDSQSMAIREWPMQAGDVVAFHFQTLHGARGNHSTHSRRAFSLRLLGDDARFVERPGRTSPPFPGHNMTTGQRLRKDWFPVIYPRGN